MNIERYDSSFFQYRELDIEIQFKLQSANYETLEYYSALKRYLYSKNFLSLDPLDQFQVQLVNNLKNEPYMNYMHHPYRVCYSYINYLSNPRMNDLYFCLAHNIIELGINLNNAMTQETFTKIEILTIDRKKEKDKVYRKDFYDKIEEHSPDLIVFKGFDKLDNTLSWVLLDLEKYHVDVVLDEVCPRISRYFPKLANYLESLVYFTIDSKNKDYYKKNYAT